MAKFSAFAGLALLTTSYTVNAAPGEVELAVWANEAIVSTYSYNFNNFMQRQKEIAKYFTAKGWTDFSTAFIASKLPEAVKANSYYVSAVATLPPSIKTVGPAKWQATMPLLVVYKNPQYQQKQTVEVTINFTQVPTDQGVRGLAITSLQSKIMKPTCKCDLDDENGTTPTNGQEQPQGAAQ
ncbi:MAG: DotI/IcmL/TraM family protein [Tatlockia sp.]|nr:DotI/IcmL/TraM family protein [Tatlockia sp.]